MVGPAPLIPGERVSTAPTSKSLGCSLAGDASPFPAGSLTGSIALIDRGTCNFSEKVYNAQRGGAIATIIYNGTANGDAVATMGAGVHAADVTIPSWEIGNTNGVNTLAWANANPTTAQAKFDPTPLLQPNAGDVMAGFSSRGPTTDKLLKPDVVAPGVNVLSGGYGTGAFPAPFTGFGQVSGTSMATPHVAGSAALLAVASELDAGSDQVGAHDDGHRERLDDYGQDNSRRRARPWRRPHRPDEGREPGHHGRSPEPQCG